jgi:hypothetical protein
MIYMKTINQTYIIYFLMTTVFTPSTTMLVTEHLDGIHAVRFMNGWEMRQVSDYEIKFSGQVDIDGLFHILPISKRTNTGRSSKLMRTLHEFLHMYKSTMDGPMYISFMSTLSVFIMFNTHHVDPDRFHFTCHFGQPCCKYRMSTDETIYILPVRDRLIKIHFAVSENGPEAVIIGKMLSK